MSHNTLIDKIKQDAATEVAKIKQVGADKVAEIERETDRVVAEMTDTHTADLKKQRERAELVAVSRARQAGRIAVQQAKRDQIDALFIAVAKDLAGQPSDAYVACFTKHARTIVPAQVAVTKVDAPAARVTETADILTQLGLTGTVVANDAIQAGFVLHSADGVYDVTLDRIMSEQRATLEMEVVGQVMK